MKIQRLLIANRGEIACRIIRSARRLGIHTIAVYSTADSNALHKSMADDAVCIGEPPAGESYLNIPRILDTALEMRADAIHTGYGFLAENAEFAEACAERGIVFVGPPPQAMRAMGLKGAARELMAQAGVPVLPGINHLPEADAAAQLEAIGYPLLLKPEAGGGGKGMKVVEDARQLEAALKSARREAKSAFGNDSLMAERYLRNPRHIEIQVFADANGNCIHLNERDCSLQRRHQKIVEESPAPGFDPATRSAMGEAAVTAAKAIGYVGAGTVEFLLGDDNRFYFMEMNTRLQVEHPVTEMVTGQDLVAWQLQIAAGESLPLTQAEVSIDGHAIEARIYAEDPLNDFLPASGRISTLHLPTGGPWLRIDNGIQAGEQMGVFYDPMMMKIITHGQNRSQAIDRLRAALAELRIAGLRTNRDFLCHILDHEPFRQGGVATDYLDQHLTDVFTAPDRAGRRAVVCAAALALCAAPPQHQGSPWYYGLNYRFNGAHSNRLGLVVGADTVDIELSWDGSSVLCSFEGATSHCRIRRTHPCIELDCDGERYQFHIVRDEAQLSLFSGDRSVELALPLVDASQAEDEGNVQAPMSGRIVSLLIDEGDTVTRGTPLVIIEAMKMEHTVRAPHDGNVVAIHYAEGELVDEGCELLELGGDEAE